MCSCKEQHKCKCEEKFNDGIFCDENAPLIPDQNDPVAEKTPEEEQQPEEVEQPNKENIDRDEHLVTYNNFEIPWNCNIMCDEDDSYKISTSRPSFLLQEGVDKSQLVATPGMPAANFFELPVFADPNDLQEPETLVLYFESADTNVVPVKFSVTGGDSVTVNIQPIPTRVELTVPTPTVKQELAWVTIIFDHATTNVPVYIIFKWFRHYRPPNIGWTRVMGGKAVKDYFKLTDESVYYDFLSDTIQVPRPIMKVHIPALNVVKSEVYFDYMGNVYHYYYGATGKRMMNWFSKPSRIRSYSSLKADNGQADAIHNFGGPAINIDLKDNMLCFISGVSFFERRE